MTEEEIATLFERVAGDLNVPRIDGLISGAERTGRRLRHRHRAFQAAGSVLAVGAIVVAGTTAGFVPRLTRALSPTSTSPSPSPTRPAATATGFPPFIVVTQGSSLQVFNTSTGAAVGSLAAPAGLEFDDVNSGGTSQTFLADANPDNLANPNPAAPTAPCHAYYYRFRLTATGQPQGLTLLRSIPGGFAGGMAASPGGGTYAYDATGCDVGNGLPIGNGFIGISGQAGNHTWAYDEGDNYTFSLAATSGTGELALSLADASNNWADLLLNTGSDAATVDGASRVVPAVPYAQTLAISPDGATLYACVSSQTTGQGQLAAYSAATGTLIRVLHTWTLPPGGNYNCQVSADATGTLLLAGFSSSTPTSQTPASLIAINPQSGTAVKLPISGNVVIHGVWAAW